MGLGTSILLEFDTNVATIYNNFVWICSCYINIRFK